MNRSEWATCTHPSVMLAHIRPSMSLGLPIIATDRQLRLIACAISRLSSYHDDEHMGAIRDAERWADGEEIDRGEWYLHHRDPYYALTNIIRLDLADREDCCWPFREIVNPFLFGVTAVLNPSADARAIAEAAYEDRDYDMLPVLADALEEKGSAVPEVILHLRSRVVCHICLGTGLLPLIRSNEKCFFCNGSGSLKIQHHHIRGCWALDFVRGIQ
jgi:hypothetical protein